MEYPVVERGGNVSREQELEGTHDVKSLTLIMSEAMLISPSPSTLYLIVLYMKKLLLTHFPPNCKYKFCIVSACAIKAKSVIQLRGTHVYAFVRCLHQPNASIKVVRRDRPKTRVFIIISNL